MPSISVLVPCLNERDNLAPLVARVTPVLTAMDGELVLIDDGSTDGSDRVFDALAATPHVRVVRHPRRLGIPEAWSSGLAAASSEWIGSLDADLQYQPEDVPRLLSHARTHDVDFVQGSRERVESEGPVRHLLSRGLNSALNLTFRTQAADHKSALFVCRREHLARLLEHRHHFRHWQCFIGVSARALGLSCGEVPVSFRPRARGVSAFGALPWRSTLEVLADFAPALRLYGRSVR